MMCHCIVCLFVMLWLINITVMKFKDYVNHLTFKIKTIVMYTYIYFWICKGLFNKTTWTRWGERGSKNLCFCLFSGYNNCPCKEGVKKWQNSVQIVVECPLRSKLPNQEDFLAKHWIFLEIVCRASPVVF